MYKKNGFTLVEVIIVIAILGLLLSFGISPSLDYLANGAVRGKADELKSYVSQARSEAIKRNTTVTFSYDNGTVTLSAGGQTIVSNAIGASAQVTPAVSTVSFSGSGRTIPLGSTMLLAVTHPSRTCKTAGGSITCLNIEVGAGGLTRMCDPSQAKTSIYGCP